MKMQTIVTSKLRKLLLIATLLVSNSLSAMAAAPAAEDVEIYTKDARKSFLSGLFSHIRPNYTREEKKKMKALEKCAVTLEDDLITYHWAPKTSAMRERLFFTNTFFFNNFILGRGPTDVEDLKAGYGLYVSKNPFDSRKYANDEEGILLAVTIKKGQKFLDVYDKDMKKCLKDNNLTKDDYTELSPNIAIKYFKAFPWINIKLKDRNAFSIKKASNKHLPLKFLKELEADNSKAGKDHVETLVENFLVKLGESIRDNSSYFVFEKCIKKDSNGEVVIKDFRDCFYEEDEVVAGWKTRQLWKEIDKLKSDDAPYWAANKCIMKTDGIIKLVGNWECLNSTKRRNFPLGFKVTEEYPDGKVMLKIKLKKNNYIELEDDQIEVKAYDKFRKEEISTLVPKTAYHVEKRKGKSDLRIVKKYMKD